MSFETMNQSFIELQIKGDNHPKTEKRLQKLREDRFVQIAKQRGEKW